ncbi:MAG: hypothetical protein Q7U04_17675 [Bacteriovorax sp.]|nr:hypothetical protein [Bacteriovorax sp.]
MKIFVFIFINIAGLIGFYLWDQSIQEKNIEHEEVIIKDLSDVETTKAFSKIEHGEQKRSHQDTVDDSLAEVKYIPKTNYEIKNYDWRFVEALAVNGEMKKSTYRLLDSLESADQANAVIDFAARAEIVQSIVDFNQNPKEATQVLEFLLTQSEITDNDGLVANLLKFANYIKCDKSKIINLADQIVISETIDKNATGVLDTNTKNQISKINEAAKLVLESKYNNKQEAIDYVKLTLERQPNPLLRHGIMSQFSIYFPEEQQKLERVENENGEEGLDNYLLKEVGTK